MNCVNRVNEPIQGYAGGPERQVSRMRVRACSESVRRTLNLCDGIRPSLVAVAFVVRNFEIEKRFDPVMPGSWERGQV